MKGRSPAFSLLTETMMKHLPLQYIMRVHCGLSLYHSLSATVCPFVPSLSSLALGTPLAQEVPQRMSSLSPSTMTYDYSLRCAPPSDASLPRQDIILR